MKVATGRGKKVVYQITADGKYCVGWKVDEDVTKTPNGWMEFPFSFDIDKVCDAIEQHLSKYPAKRGTFDGIYEKGFRMKVCDRSMASESEGIKNPFYGIFYFEPFTCFYAC